MHNCSQNKSTVRESKASYSTLWTLLELANNSGVFIATSDTDFGVREPTICGLVHEPDCLFLVSPKIRKGPGIRLPVSPYGLFTLVEARYSRRPQFISSEVHPLSSLFLSLLSTLSPIPPASISRVHPRRSAGRKSLQDNDEDGRFRRHTQTFFVTALRTNL